MTRLTSWPDIRLRVNDFILRKERGNLILMNPEMIQTSMPAANSATPRATTGLEAAAELFRALNEDGVRYCHWKSNVRLEKALQGKTDLDLLVEREDSDRFRKILSEHRVKPLVAAPGKAYPALENYLGFDPASGELFHLHVHYQLVLGEQFVKNYRLPLETHFLDSTRLYHGVKVPAPELELIVLSLRALLKYRDRDVIKDILSIRSPGLPGDIVREIQWLLPQTSLEQIAETLQELQIVPADIVLGLLHTVNHSRRDGYRLYRLRARLRNSLRPWQRHNRFHASLLYYKALWRRRKSFLKRTPNRKMTLANGGQTLAFVGADGAGKSTMCSLLSEWLSWKLDAHLYYLGSKQPSRRSELLYLLFRIARRSQRAWGRLLGEKSLPVRWLATLRQSLLYSHHLSIGYDRYRRYRASRKQAGAGSLVIYDRFPLAASLDGPKIEIMANGNQGPVAGLFSRLERRLYRKFEAPDYYFLLDVHPDVSLQRKPDHERAAIERKYRVLQNLAEHKSNGVELVRVDANRSFETVAAQLKNLLWQIM